MEMLRDSTTSIETVTEMSEQGNISEEINSDTISSINTEITDRSVGIDTEQGAGDADTSYTSTNITDSEDAKPLETHGLPAEIPTYYSDDFESPTPRQHATTSRQYSDDFESPTPRQHATTSRQYSDDFESPRHNSITNKQYSDDFESSISRQFSEEIESPMSQQHSTTLGQYSDDFEQTTTARQYSDDFEPTTAMGYSDDFETAASTGLAYSSDFDGATTNRTGRLLASHQSYSMSFESDESSAVSTQPSSSSASRTESLIDSNKQVDGSSKSYYSTDDSITQSESSVSEETREVENQALSQFLMRKLNVARGIPMESPHNVHTPRPPTSGRLDTIASAYCQNKLKVLYSKLEKPKVDRKEDTFERVDSGNWQAKAQDPVEKYGILNSTVNRLKTYNLLHAMRNAANEKIHNPSKCRDCMKVKEDLASREFVKCKMAISSERLVKEKLQNQTYLYTDVVGMMGEGVRELPSHKDCPKDIMKKLLAPLHEAHNHPLDTGSSHNKTDAQAKLNKLHSERRIIQTQQKGDKQGFEFQSKRGHHNLRPEHLDKTDAAEKAAEVFGLPQDNSQLWEMINKPLHAAPWWPKSQKQELE